MDGVVNLSAVPWTGRARSATLVAVWDVWATGSRVNVGQSICIWACFQRKPRLDGLLGRRVPILRSPNDRWYPVLHPRPPNPRNVSSVGRWNL